MADLVGNSGWKQTPNAAIKQRLNWAVTTEGSALNYSTVIVSYWLKKDPNIQNLATTSNDCKFTIQCGGKTVSNSQIDQYYNQSMTLLPNNTEKCVARHTFTIPHNADGTKSITIKVTGGFGGTSISYYKLSVSKTLTLPTIKRASLISGVTNTVIGNNVSVSWTPYSRSFYYRLKFVFGQHTYTVGTSNNPIFPNTAPSSGIGVSYTYSGFTVPTELIDEIINAESAKMLVYLYTFSDSGYTKQIGFADLADFTITIPSNLYPTINSCNVSSVVNHVPADGYVNYTFSITASGIHGSTIQSAHVSYGYYEGDTTKHGDKEFSTTSITDNGDGTYSCTVSTGFYKFGLTREVDDSDVLFSVNVKDSRGRLTQIPYMYAESLWAYSPPIIQSFKASRNGTNANVVDIWLLAYCSSVHHNNSIHGIVNYREVGSDVWKSAGYIHSTDAHPVATRLLVEEFSIEPVDGDVFLENHSYEIQVYVYDSAENVVTAQTYISVVDVLIDFKAGGTGLGIGKMVETDSVEVALPSKFFDTAEFSDQVTFNDQTSFKGQTKFDESLVRVINNTERPIADMINYGSYYVGSSKLASGFALNDNNIPMRFGRVGNIVHVMGNINVTTAISLNDAKNGKTFFTLPTGYRPTNEVFIMCKASNMYSWVLHIDTNGQMKLSRYGKTDFEAIAANTIWFPFNATFFVYDNTAVEYT